MQKVKWQSGSLLNQQLRLGPWTIDSVYKYSKAMFQTTDRQIGPWFLIGRAQDVSFRPQQQTSVL
jgi:hypothetical protein